jgi:hypothetical protein
MTPLYTHDCEKCKYLGTGTAQILTAQMLRIHQYDFYICADSSEYRTCIARYGDFGSEYISGLLFSCEELTRFDKVFLYNGIELTEQEEKRALRILVSMYKQQLSFQDCKSFSTGCSFGSGNIFWKDN